MDPFEGSGSDVRSCWPSCSATRRALRTIDLQDRFRVRVAPDLKRIVVAIVLVVAEKLGFAWPRWRLPRL